MSVSRENLALTVEALEEARDRDLDYVSARKLSHFISVRPRMIGKALAVLEEEGHLEKWGSSAPQTYRIVSIDDIQIV